MIVSKMFICFTEQEVIQVSNIYFVFRGKKESLKINRPGSVEPVFTRIFCMNSHTFSTRRAWRVNLGVQTGYPARRVDLGHRRLTEEGLTRAGNQPGSCKRPHVKALTLETVFYKCCHYLACNVSESVNKIIWSKCNKVSKHVAIVYWLIDEHKQILLWEWEYFSQYLYMILTTTLFKYLLSKLPEHFAIMLLLTLLQFTQSAK